MATIDGKYQLVENQNFLEFLQKTGVPAEQAQKLVESKPIVNAKRSGDKISVDAEGSVSVEYILNQEVDEVIKGIALKSTATLDGDVLTISSRGEKETQSGKRIYKFTDTGYEVTLLAANGAQAKRIYKRI